MCTRSDSDNGGFMKLFRYISGANARSEINKDFMRLIPIFKFSEQKIDMTVPVMMTHGEKV